MSTPIPSAEQLQELAKHEDDECNQFLHRKCYRRACLLRGGWEVGKPVDYSVATCRPKELAAALRALSQVRKLVEQLKDDWSADARCVAEDIATILGDKEAPAAVVGEPPHA